MVYIPAKIVTNNRPTFISHDVSDILNECSVLMSQLHPVTNGLAERGV